MIPITLAEWTYLTTGVAIGMILGPWLMVLCKLVGKTNDELMRDSCQQWWEKNREFHKKKAPSPEFSREMCRNRKLWALQGKRMMRRVQ